MQARLNELARESGTLTHESLQTGHDAHREDFEGLALLLMDHPALSMPSGAR